MSMVNRSPDAQLFLKTHPNRMFRVGDDVFHTNRMGSSTPARGVVTQVAGAKRSGIVVVRWMKDDGSVYSTTQISSVNALENLAVSIHNLSTRYHDFGGAEYVEKYFGFAMKLGDLKAGFACPTHAIMKAAISTRPDIVDQMRADAKARESAPAKPRHHKYIAVNVDNGHQIGLEKQADLVNYPEGEYVLYSQTRIMKVVSEVKKSIIA